MNLSDASLSKGEIDILLLGLSYCPTPKRNGFQVEEDIFEFTRKVRLKFEFANSKKTVIESTPPLVKLPSKFMPKKNVHHELEEILRPVEWIRIKDDEKVKDNIKNREDLESLVHKTVNNQVIIKPADKGDMIVIQNSDDYQKMCLDHLSNKEYYEDLGFENPTFIVKQKVCALAKKYKQMLHEKEYEFLTVREHKMSNFYMLPKLHKNAELNEILVSSDTAEEYLQLKLKTKVEGRPIISGPAYHTSGLSQMLHLILQPVLEKVEHIVKDTFDFIERFDTLAEDDPMIVTWDIKSLYPNIRHDLFHDAISYWIDKHRNDIPLLKRFSKDFILDALFVILKYNYAYFDGHYYHQIKGTATGTTFAVVGANLVVAYKEVHLFQILPEIFPREYVEWFITNYFRFLDDVCHKWLRNFDLEDFAKAINEMDKDLVFIMDAIKEETHYLDVKMKIIDNEIHFDIYHKPTNAFGYLRYESSHPNHTIKNIALSLGKRIVRITSTLSSREERLEELQAHLVARDHPELVIERALSKLFQPSQKTQIKEKIILVETFNPNHSYNKAIVKKCTQRSRHPKVLKAFDNTEVMLATRQPQNLRKILTRSKFDLRPKVKYKKPPGLFPCRNCTYCQRQYITPRKSFELKVDGKVFEWIFKRHFTCDSLKVIYVCVNFVDEDFYVGRTKVVKKRTAKHISDINLKRLTTCKEFVQHIIDVSDMKEPYFAIIPFYYVEDDNLRDFMEKRFIQRLKPKLNGYNI